MNESRRYITLDDFGANDATLKPAHTARLDQFVAEQRAESQGIRLQGFADLSETDPAGVSRQRAQAMSAYLTSHGIASSRIVVETYGAEWARVGTIAGRTEPRNRRVQIAVSGR